MVFKIDIIDANSGHNSQYFLGMTTWRCMLSKSFYYFIHMTQYFQGKPIFN